MRRVLAECAHGAARTKASQFASFYRALAARCGSKGAILATGYKLLRTVYAVLREDRHYRNPGIDYEQLQVQRSALRRLAKLRKFGYLPESAESSYNETFASPAGTKDTNRGCPDRPTARRGPSGTTPCALESPQRPPHHPIRSNGWFHNKLHTCGGEPPRVSRTPLRCDGV